MRSIRGLLILLTTEILWLREELGTFTFSLNVVLRLYMRSLQDGEGRLGMGYGSRITVVEKYKIPMRNSWLTVRNSWRGIPDRKNSWWLGISDRRNYWPLRIADRKNSWWLTKNSRDNFHHPSLLWQTTPGTMLYLRNPVPVCFVRVVTSGHVWLMCDSPTHLTPERSLHCSTTGPPIP